MTSVKPFAWCILCPDTFGAEEEAKAHFRKTAHGWSRAWEHGFDGRAAEVVKRKKDRRRTQGSSGAKE